MRAAALKHVSCVLPATPGHAGLAFPSSSAAKGLKILISGQDPFYNKEMWLCYSGFQLQQLAVACLSPIKCSGDLRSSKSQREGEKLGERWLYNWKRTRFFLIKNNKITSSIEGWIPVTDPLRMSSLSLNVSLNKSWKLILIKCSSKTKLPSTKHLKASFLSWKIQKETIEK